MKKKTWFIIEAIISIIGLGFILASSIIQVATFGMNGFPFIGAIMFIVMASSSLLAALAALMMLKKEGKKLVGASLDIVYNSLGVALIIASVFLSIDSNNTLMYALCGMTVIFFSVYGFLEKNKKLRPFAPFSYILLIACFILYIFLDYDLYSLIGFIIIIFAMIIHMIKAIFNFKKNKNDNDDINAKEKNTTELKEELLPDSVQDDHPLDQIADKIDNK